MRLEIVVAPPTPARAAASRISSDDPAAAAAAAPRSPHAPARDILDVFIDGARVTAPLRETHGAFVLRDLAHALADLARQPRAKTAVRFYDEPWELCVERFGATACLSVYRTGASPLVSIYDRAVPFHEVVLATRRAVELVLARVDRGVAIELTSALERLQSLPAIPEADAGVPPSVPVLVEPAGEVPVSFGAEFLLRERPSMADDAPARDAADATEPGPDEVERSDMHALLFRGRVTARIRGRSVDLGECHPILLAERLIDLSRHAFDAWERGVPFNARGDASGVLVGVRISTGGELALTVGRTQRGAGRTVHTFPALAVADLLDAALAFGRALVHAILRRDRSQFGNLRLGALRRALRESAEALRQNHRTDSKVNPTPEPYRAFAAALDSGPTTAPSPATMPSLAGARLRYANRWRAIVPGIDLRATYLCGDRLIVGAATEMWALDRTTGHVLWRVDVPRGTSVVTPAGIARLAGDGVLRIFDFASGESRLRARISPRVGPVAGAVVHLPGLPKLLVVTEGEHHLVALDLTSGEPRWRWSWGGGRAPGRASPRIKRAGKLVYFTSGNAALTALDVQTGDVVWRLRDRLRFRVAPTLAHDALFVVAGGAHGMAHLYCVDPYAGNVRWSRPVSQPTAPCSVEGPVLVAGSAVAVALRRKSGLTLVCFRREDGAPIVVADRAVAPSGTSWLAIDDAFIGNTPTGELVAVDAHDGALRWRHVLGPRPLQADVPRRLEPVLRCGALFVPCSLVSVVGGRALDEAGGAAAGVSILRPSDGAPLGAIAPSDVIPDLLRVDERCDVFIAEESGHVAAFGALPRLSLVR
ncbi:MAG TPA: PQQ-binding-like beta-propeller repeat protein [Polyangiaceae bacterium]|nr:PQQ-binding-like beta-propeller repeat protein [Polyangiaceae bacterium]